MMVLTKVSRYRANVLCVNKKAGIQNDPISTFNSAAIDRKNGRKLLCLSSNHSPVYIIYKVYTFHYNALSEVDSNENSRQPLLWESSIHSQSNLANCLQVSGNHSHTLTCHAPQCLVSNKQLVATTHHCHHILSGLVAADFGCKSSQTIEEFGRVAGSG